MFALQKLTTEWFQLFLFPPSVYGLQVFRWRLGRYQVREFCGKWWPFPPLERTPMAEGHNPSIGTLGRTLSPRYVRYILDLSSCDPSSSPVGAKATIMICVYIYIHTKIYQVHNHISENKYTNRKVNHYFRMCRMPRNMYIITYNDQRTQQQLYMNSMFWGLTQMMYLCGIFLLHLWKGTPYISYSALQASHFQLWLVLSRVWNLVPNRPKKLGDTGLTGIMVYFRGIIPKWPQDSG